MFLHDLEELDNDFARRSDQDLSLARFFGIVLDVSGRRCATYNVVEAIVQNRYAGHGCDVCGDGCAYGCE